MQKIKLLALTIILILSFTLSASAGQMDVKSVVFAIDMDEYFIDGQEPVKMDVAPFIQDDRTFVPVRYLGNALGVGDKDIVWFKDEQRVILKDSNIIELIIGNNKIWVNGQFQDMDVAPVIINDRTFLPARYVAEALGYEVAWDTDTQTVICYLKDSRKNSQKPDVKSDPEIVRFINEVLGMDMEHDGKYYWSVKLNDMHYSFFHYFDNGKHSEDVIYITYFPKETPRKELNKVRTIVEKYLPDCADDIMNIIETKETYLYLQEEITFYPGWSDPEWYYSETGNEGYVRAGIVLQPWITSGNFISICVSVPR